MDKNKEPDAAPHNRLGIGLIKEAGRRLLAVRAPRRKPIRPLQTRINERSPKALFAQGFTVSLFHLEVRVHWILDFC
jgi:hypothetical protein